MRIVSLLPSATEMIAALGLSEQLVGVSHECDYPPGIERLPTVTQTIIDHHASSRAIDIQVRQELSSKKALYSLDSPRLAALNPDLIVTQSLCDVCAVAEHDVTRVASELTSQPAIFNMQPLNFIDVLDTISALGEAAAVTDLATKLRSRLEQRVHEVRARSASIAVNEKPQVVFLEWLDPPFNAGHWNPDLITIAGGHPLLATTGEASTTLDYATIRANDPDCIVIGCCGFDIERTLKDVEMLAQDRTWATIRCVQQGNVHVVDGNAYFNRPGPRLVDSLELLAHILHPHVHPLPADVTPPVAIGSTANR